MIKKWFYGLFFAASTANSSDVVDFLQVTDLQDWQIVNDAVMGGMSVGDFRLNTDNQAVFSGEVSLANNGGFTSVRYRPQNTISIGDNTQLVIRVKGDGKSYQCRIKGDSQQAHAYITSFVTTGEWQDITIDLSSMYPSFRGRRLDIPNFDQTTIAELGLLIANKKAETFNLIIESIKLN